MGKKSRLDSLDKRLSEASGPSRQIDKEISAVFRREAEGTSCVPYTTSVDDCMALIKRALPDWRLHVGYGPMGIMPYASMTRDVGGLKVLRVEAKAPTVPLALLGALVKACKAR